MSVKLDRFRAHYYKDSSFWATNMKKAVVWLFRTAFFFGLCYLFLFPLLYMFSTAFQSADSLSDPSVVWVPKDFSLTTMKTVIDLLDYWESMALTLEITVLSTLFTLISCSSIGYGFARFRFAEKNLMFIVVVLMIVIPPQAIVVASYTNFQFFDFGGLTRLLEPLTGVSSYNLLNTPLTFVLPAMFGCGLRSGLFIFIFRQFFAGIPQELDEAAKIDGCGPLRTFVRIMVPMAVPAFITTCLFSAVWHWNDMYTMGMYFTTEIRPITPTLADLTAAMMNSNIINHVGTTLEVRSYFAAASLLTVLPPLLLYIVLQRHFTESIEKTGIVG